MRATTRSLLIALLLFTACDAKSPNAASTGREIDSPDAAIAEDASRPTPDPPLEDAAIAEDASRPTPDAPLEDAAPPIVDATVPVEVPDTSTMTPAEEVLEPYRVDGRRLPPITEGGPFVLPRGCKLDTDTRTENGCEQEFSCDHDHVSISCSEAGDGVWDCHCGTAFLHGNYELLGVNEETACATMNDVCRMRVVPEFDAEPVCELQRETRRVGACDTYERCKKSAKLAGGVTIRATVDHRVIDCTNEGDGKRLCECETASSWYEFQLTGVPIAEMCSFAGELCHPAGPPSADSAMECETTEPIEDEYIEIDLRFCEQSQVCTPHLQSIGDAVVAYSAYTTAFCYGVDADERSECQCSNLPYYDGGPFTLWFTLDEEPRAPACEHAIAACSPEPNVSLSESVACESLRSETGLDSCRSSFECRQAAMAGDVPIEFSETFDSYCRKTESDDWSCYCNSPWGVAPFDITAPDEEGACLSAETECREAITVHEGPEGPYIGIEGLTPFSRTTWL